MNARALYEALVGRRTGIVKHLAFAETIDGDASLFHAGAEVAKADPRISEPMRAGGAGATREAAATAALCEAVERYAGAGGGPRTPPRARRELGGASLDPATFGLFARRPFVPDDDTPLCWMRGREIVTGEDVFVPRFAVDMPYVQADGEPGIDASTTTGLACGRSLDEAIARAAGEVVERDALALHWVLGLTPPEIPTSEARDLLPPRDLVRAFDLTTDLGMPVVLVVAEGAGPRGSIVSAGSAADADPRRALRKAALEASQDRVYVRMLIDEDPDWLPLPDFSNVDGFSRHARLYSASPALAARGLAFLRGGGERALAPGMTAREAFAARGLQAVAVDRTPSWAEALGLFVVRVVAPSLVPLHGHHLLRYEAHPRLDARHAPRASRRHGRAIWPYPHAMA